jgi:hypothetical protein
MLQKTRYLFLLILLFLDILPAATAQQVPGQKKSSPAQGTLPVQDIRVAASTGHPKETAHCFPRDNKRALTFFIKMGDTSSGQTTVQIMNLGDINSLRIPATATTNPPSIKVGLKSGRISNHRSTVVFPGDSVKSASPTFEHLGAGPYVAVLAISGTGTLSSKGISGKPVEDVSRYLFYYDTFKNDPSECSLFAAKK